VDAFDASRDEILLDDNAEEDPRLDEFDGDTHEVLGMNLDDEDNDSDDESDHNVGDEQDDEKEEDDDLDRYRTMILPSSVTESSLRRRAARDDAHKEQEEEDILENDGDDDENEYLGWGKDKRSYYSSNTMEDFESDSEVDEEKAHELETNEAVRLQRMSRSGMNDEDFGLNSIHEEEAQVAADEQSEAARVKRRHEFDMDSGAESKAQSMQRPDELLASLQVRAPIVLALIDEYNDALHQLKEECKTVDVYV